MPKRLLHEAFGASSYTGKHCKEPLTQTMATESLYSTFFRPVSCGAYHSAIVDVHGNLWTWGNNQYFQLGSNTQNDYQSTPLRVELPATIKIVKSGAYHCGVIDIYGSLWIWGRNSHFQTSADNIPTVNVPTRITLSIPVSFTNLACGYAHTIALDENNNIWSWGSNEHGQLCTGENNTVQQRPTKIQNFEQKISSLACGYYHSVVVDERGCVYTCGNNEHGQLGILDHTRTLKKVPKILNVINIACGAYHVTAVDEEGMLWAWGWNSMGQIGVEHRKDVYEPTRVHVKGKVVSTSCGYSHSAVITEDGSLLGFGFSGNGELGIGEQEIATTPTLIHGTGISQYVNCGGNHTISVDDQGKLWGTGWNEEGQLGVGNWDDHFTMVSISPSITVLNKSLQRGRKTKPSYRPKK